MNAAEQQAKPLILRPRHPLTVGGHFDFKRMKTRHWSRGGLGVARVTGLEPATSGVTGRRSNQLSYTRNLVPGGVRCPGCTVKTAGTRLLLNRSPQLIGLGGDGFEPPALSV